MARGSDLLAQAGVNGVATEPYRCAECNDTGWSMVVKEGREFFARCLPCAKRQWDESCARKFKPGLTWKDWKRRAELDAQVKALSDWRGDPWCALLHGDDDPRSDNRGAGKTHAAMATGRAWVGRGVSVLAWHWPTWVQRKRAAISDPAAAPSAPDLHDGLLILDDLGERDVRGQPERPPTRWEVELLTLIVTAREAASLPTIVTTNLGLNELDRKFYRSADRMAAGLRLRWVAESWRRK